MSGFSKKTNPRERDAELVIRAKEGDISAFTEIVSLYGKKVFAASGNKKVAGAEKDDLFQEGMIGLVKAVRSYDASAGASFKTYASVCIDNQIKSAITSASRAKHIPLNNYLSFEGIELIENSNEVTPEDTVIGHEQFETGIHKLSKFERQVLLLKLEGDSYSVIAKKLGKNVKAIENAVCRVKKKFCE